MCRLTQKVPHFIIHIDGLVSSSGSLAIFAAIRRAGTCAVEREAFRDLGASDEIRSEPVADRFGGDLGGPVLRVDLGTLLGEALLRPGNIVVDVGGRGVADHNFAGRNFD